MSESSPAEVVHVDPTPLPAGLFGTSDPVAVIESAQRLAKALKNVIDQQHLTTNIQGREHVRVEGWTTLGAMLGVFPVVEWTKPLESGDGWEARVVARTLSGDEVGAAEAMCTRKENTWRNRDDYAIRSMAQTRATSKAMRLPLGFIIQLAGYDPTPAEEMTFHADAQPVPPRVERRVEPNPTNDAKRQLLAETGNDVSTAQRLWKDAASNYGLGPDADAADEEMAQAILEDALQAFTEEKAIRVISAPKAEPVFDESMTAPFDLEEPDPAPKAKGGRK